MARIRAPELTGRGWVGAAADTTLASLRGRFVLLDFWTFCCVNCLHVLDELRPLEESWADVLDVVGVHSPKFAHEAEAGAVESAVARYGVPHAVLDDAEMTTWQAYAAKAWPTLVLVDPEGFIVARYAGEGHAHAIDALLGELVPRAAAAGLLGSDAAARAAAGHAGAVTPTPTPMPTPTSAPPSSPPSPPTRTGPPSPSSGSSGLAFPSGILDLGDGRLLVADTAHHQVVVLDTDHERVLERIGTGTRGLTDGPASTAQFNEPQGLCRLPADVADEVGYDVVVADTVNHALRGLRLADGAVTTLVGSGRAWTPLEPTALSSPWDVAWWQGRVWVAMAGIHQLWAFDPTAGTEQPAALPAAGTRTEGLRDGPLESAWFAQPSALSASADRLWLVDAETSALRWVADGAVHTAVGRGLFDFGFVDGPSDEALLQHPLGVAALDDGTVAVADTYNGAVRVYDPARDDLRTLATGMAEPSALLVGESGLVVLESAAHRVVVVPRDARAAASDVASRTERPPTLVAPGRVRLVVEFEPPPGQALDERYGPATRMTVSATPGALLRAGDGASTSLNRELVLDDMVGEGVLHVTAAAASCDASPGTASSGAACHLHQQDWGVPVVLTQDAPAVLRLSLGG